VFRVQFCVDQGEAKWVDVAKLPLWVKVEDDPKNGGPKAPPAEFAPPAEA
jgi:hypothetical protein